MSQNRELKRMFGTVRQKVTSGWNIRENESLHLYSSPNIINTIKLKG
jgi:hypothetical protein